MQADQNAADQLAERDGEPDGRPVVAERPVALGRGEDDADGRQHLWGQGGSGDALHETRRDQHVDRRGETAKCGGREKGGHPGQEHRLATEQVAESAAGDQTYGIGDRIEGDDQLRLPCTGPETFADRREGDVDDGEVERQEERPREQDGQHKPASGITTVVGQWRWQRQAIGNGIVHVGWDLHGGA